MAVRSATSTSPQLFRTTAFDWLRNGVSVLVGIACLAVACWLAVALATYSSGDPSINHATSATPENVAGVAGAYVADVSLTWAGLAALLPAFVLIGWAHALIRFRKLTRPLLRVFCLVISFVLLMPVLANLWPDVEDMPAGAGGLGGILVLDMLAVWIDSYELSLSWLVTALVAMSMLTFPVAAAMSFSGVFHGVGGAVSRMIRKRPALRRRLVPVRFRIRRFGLRRFSLRLPPFLQRVRSGQFRRRSRSTENEPRVMTGSPPKAPGRKRKATKKTGTAARSKADATSTRQAQEKKYTFPPTDLLEATKRSSRTSVSQRELEEQAEQLQTVLSDFGIRGEIVNARPGPVVTRFDLEPDAGIRANRIIALSDDIARSMSAVSARVAIVTGSKLMGIELPKRERELVLLRELLESPAFTSKNRHLPVILGKDISGAPVIEDLVDMPHLLIAGTTGSGKSVGVNAMILSLLFRLSPKECRLILIDPKMLELSVYDDIPHLLAPVVTEPAKAVQALNWVVREMERRYRSMQKVNARNITVFNEKVRAALARNKPLIRQVQVGFHPETGEPVHEQDVIATETLPYIVVVVDEMADLMLVAGREIEGAVQRLAQMARAAGIHIIMATQRPSVDVITGTIKANFPSRISFHVASKTDSRTIFNEHGAEQLLGKGDMLFAYSGRKMTRIHGPFVSDEEVTRVAENLRQQGKPDYLEDITEEHTDVQGGTLGLLDKPTVDKDQGLYDQAVYLVTTEKKASTSFVQRHLKIGYNRAANIVERMEREGVVSSPNHVNKREVLAPPPPGPPG